MTADVKVVKSLEKKKRGRPEVAPTSGERETVLAVLRAASGPEGFVARTKKELVTITGLDPRIVAKVLDSEPDVSKVGSKKGTKYKIL